MAANLVIEVGADIKGVAQGFKSLDNTLSTTGKQLGVLTKSSNASTLAMTNLGRVVQDAPFGFLGISNNLNPLLESFQRLRAESGSNSAALKALGSSLIGAGGLGFAISIISSLLIVFGDKLFKSSTAAESHAEALKKAKQALADYVDSLNDIDQARIKGLQSAQEELVKLKSIYDATQNTNISIAQRKKLVDELQEQYPKYFANIKDEVILAGGAKKAYDELSTAILASAKARAAQDVLVDIQKQILAVDQQIAESTVNQIKLQQQLNTLKLKPLVETSATGEERLTSVGAKVNKVQQQLNGFVSEGNKLFKQRNDLLSRAQVLSDNISKTVEKNPEALLNPTGNIPKSTENKKANDDLKKQLDEKKAILLDFVKDFETIKVKFPDLSKPLEDFDTKTLTQELRFKLANAITGLTETIGTVRGIDPKKVPIPLVPHIVWKPSDFVQRLDEFNSQLSTLVTNLKITAFETLGQSIADAINGGGVESAFKNVGNIMGSFLQELGKLLIKMAVATEAFKKAFAALLANPAAAIGVGIGLVALGGIIKNAVLPKAKPFADGGLVFGPTLGLIGEGRGTNRNNPEVIAPLDRLQKMLSGTASQNINVTVNGGWRGNDFVLGLARVIQSQNRNFGRGGF